MKKHIIIYLDQNYFSNIAKAQCQLLKDDAEVKFWQTLYKHIKKAVSADRISCPEAEFHLTEAKFSSKLEGPISEIIKEFSGGLQLRPHQDILESQIKDAAKKYLNIKVEKREKWIIAYMSNPHSKYADRVKGVHSGRIQLYVHPHLTKAEIEIERQRKVNFKKHAKEYASTSLAYPELLLSSKLGVINGFMGNLAQQSAIEKIKGDYPLKDKLIAANKLIRIKNLRDHICEIGVNLYDNEMAYKFFRSKVLLDSPFIDINGSIWAVIEENYNIGRKPDEGDFYDVPILASSLPYCDILTADAFMKEILVNKLHFDTKYNLKIFSAKKQDRIDLLNIIKGLTY